jgi:class 3 adenylate cyclase
MYYAPKPLHIVAVVYMAFGVFFFLGSCLQLRLKSASQIVKLRSRMVLLGFAMTASLPLSDFILNAFFHIYIFPNFNYYLPFFLFFPAFIGYSIVKHDLFDIDVIIKRTYGYVLTTGAIAGIYGIFVLISNLAFGSYEFAKSPVFPLIFILAVVFLFNPIRNRVQQFNDRVFYRLEYDYQETVEKISETMRSLLNLDEIGKSIMQFALEPMFVDAGSVMILNREKTFYDCLIQSGESEQKKETHKTDEPDKQDVEKTPSEIECSTLSLDEPFMRKMAERKKTTTIYDIWEDPFFDTDRYACVKTFDQLGATLVVPLIYEDRLTGIISVGHKKSGKFYRHEDINLLNTLANQGAVAIENARMVEEVVEKERLKTKIMDAFGKYVTHEVRDQILEGRIPLDGEIKDVTVLFADLRDFTTLAESTTPKEVVKIINSYFSQMAEAISHNHGLVLQFIGDEIEAVFGAPLPLEEHPTHAVRAAMAMQKRLILVNEMLQHESYGPLRHGIGIHTGDAVAANIGGHDRLSYALVGDTVNLASRIQGLNKELGTDILISATTVERLIDNIDLEKLPTVTVRGKRDSVEIYKFA